MMGLSNNKINAALMLEIKKEFRKFISGGGTSNNLVNFIESEDASRIADSITAAITNSAKDQAAQFVKDTIVNTVLDNTRGVYTIPEILSQEPFAGVDAASYTVDDQAILNEFFLALYEDIGQPFQGALITNSFDPFFEPVAGVNGSDPASVRRLVSPLEAEFEDTAYDDLTSKDPDFFNVKETNPDTGEEVTKPLKGFFAKPKKTAGSVYVNAAEATATSLDPSLGAFVIRTPEIGFGARNDEQLNIMFNAITPLEMSRCVPYINLSVVSMESSSKHPNSMSNVKFMRFIKGKEGKFELDQNIGLTNSRPFGFVDVTSILESKFDERAVTDVSLMDVFTSPQTMANPDIRSSDASNGPDRNPVLEPISPFLSLESLSFDISGMGSALFSSKVGTMQLTLHDRSRLPDISHLVSANQFGSTKVVIEFGWSHPDQSPDSDNIVGRFLNSLRDRAVYTVKSSNFSFSDGNAVKITLNLACYGADDTKSISCAAGSQVPLSVFRSSINKIVDKVVELQSPKINGEVDSRASLREVRHLMRVGQRNAVGPSNLVEWSQFRSLVAAFEASAAGDLFGDGDNFELFRMNLAQVLFGKHQTITTDENLSSEEIKDKLNEIRDEDRENAAELIYGKLFALTDGFIGESSSDEIVVNNVDPFRLAVNTFVSETETEHSAEDVTLGKIMMSFVGHSLSMTGLFDEVQMFFYPLNEKAGQARIHTTASLPIPKSLLYEVVTKKIAKNPNLSVNGFFNLMERKIIRDKSLPAYGISPVIQSYEAQKKLLEAELEELKKNSTTEELTAEGGEADQILQAIKRAREAQKDSISVACRGFYEKDGGPPAEPDFIRPNLSMYIETLPKFVLNDTTGDMDAAGSICRIHIYDEQTSKRPQESLINSMLSEGSVGRAVVKGIGGDTDILEAVMKPVENEDSIEGNDFSEKLVNYVKKADANVLKEAVKRGYPSITYGASTGMIKSISVSSNVSNQVSQTILIASNARRDNPQDLGTTADQFEEVTVVPATVTVEMLGNPLIQRGNQIYIDFGTGTTLDNIYTVKSVKHNISAGDFSTSVELIFGGQGNITSLREKIIAGIDALS